MADTHAFVMLQDITVTVVAATVAMRIFSMLKLPLLLGFIVAGILLSPVFGLIQNADTIVELGELGVMFMMFFVGMEFNMERLKKVFAPSFLGISFQIIGMGILGMLSARAMGLSNLDGIFLGGVLAMSSTIVIVEILAQRKDLGKRYAQIAIGVLIIEDLFAVFLLVILSGLALGGGPDMGEIGRSTLMLFTFVIVIFIVGKLTIPMFLRRFAASRNPQELIMFTFCIIMGLSGLAVFAKLSLPLGAFLAGSIISGTAVSTKIEHLTNPFRNLFVALFFVSVGTMINPSDVVTLWLPIVVISVLVVVFQTMACFTGIVLGGARAKDAYLAAINKAQIGEFSFVIASLGITLKVMDPSIMTIAMGVSFLTVFVNPFLSSQSDKVFAFTNKYVPGKIKFVFDVYYNAISSMSTAAKKSEYLGAIAGPLVRIGIYTLLFNGLLIVAIFFRGVFDSEAVPIVPNEWFDIVYWLLVAALSLPIVMGVIMNVGRATRTIISMTPLVREGSSGMVAALLRVVFSFFIAILFAFFYFAFVWHYLPSSKITIVFFAAVVLLAMVFWKIFANMNSSLESKFTEVFQRHLANAEHHRHDAMMESIKKSYKWAIETGEAEITELSLASGKTVGELAVRAQTGAEIAAIKRGRFVIYNIMPDTQVFPDDIVVLSGQPEDVARAEKLLAKQLDDIERSTELLVPRRMIVVSTDILEDSPLVGLSIAQAALTKRYGVKILGMTRVWSDTPVRPAADEIFHSADRLLLMGLPESIERLKKDKRLDQCEVLGSL